jgi:N-carbamoyl-L-amino-acid hydrolase
VNLSLEIRDLSSEKMKSLFDMILERAKEIATASNVEVTYESIDATGAPAMTDASLKKIIEAQINKKRVQLYVFA